MLEVDRSSKLDFARALLPLAGFGLVHGSHEWIEMFLLIHSEFLLTDYYHYVGLGRIFLLALSFFFLLSFGIQLVTGPTRSSLHWKLLLTLTSIWLIGLIWVFLANPQSIALVSGDVYTRYVLAIPGAALTAWGLILQQRKFFQLGMKGFGYDVVIAAIAFGLYGGIGQLFVTSSPIFPSTFINAPLFQTLTGFPIQVFRTVMACIAAVFIIRSLRAFEEEIRIQIESLSEARFEERRRLEEVRGELLRRTVRAQESERQRIARELHDELGQTLTAIGLGLRAISNVATKPERVEKQASQLQALVDGGISGLQNLIRGLHPPQLDDFGLMSALRGYAREIGERYKFSVEITSQGVEEELSIDIRVVLYRIAQEGINNIIRHAGVNRASIEVIFGEDDVSIRIEDKGRGFDVETALKNPDYPSWGLRGIIERAALVGGTCQIFSHPGAGTLIVVSIPIKTGEEHVEDTHPLS